MTDLRRHVPAIALTWDDEAPGRLWRRVDGTLVFADISGFTALTERLSGRGRIGAEQIVETLNGVFTPMLDTAAARGGELLKFGGDALLFLFRGEDHLGQACDAVVEMRASLRRAGTGGRLRLSMSVGMHSGEVDLFLVGSPHRELLILGPAATATVRAEAAALAGQVVVTPETAAMLPRNAVTRNTDGHHLLTRRAARLAPTGAQAPPDVPSERLQTVFPAALGEYLGPAVPDPEHRVASIAFARFRDTDGILTHDGPEALADLLDRTVSAVCQSADAEGVTLLATDLDADGGKFFLASGVPRAGADNEGAMLRSLAALTDTALDLQIGVNRGHVFAAEVGSPTRAAYSAMGDTTNTAARLMGKSSPGRILAHPSVLDHSRTLFSVSAVGPLHLKGKAAPLTAYDVGTETGLREEGVSSRLPFTSREKEHAALDARFREALGGSGCVTSITGPPGIGKSRLVQHAIDHGPQIPVLRLRAEPYGRDSAYRVFRDPLRALLGINRDAPEAMGARLMDFLRQQRPDLVDAAPLIADVLQVPAEPTDLSRALDPQFRPDRVADAVLTVLETAAPGPLAIVVDDSHWADDASIHLLHRLAVATTARPWAIVVLHRGDGSGYVPAGAEEISLAPLSESASEQLVISATQATPLRPHEIAQIVARADGNPLFLEETTRLLAENGSVEDLPESVQAALSIQVDRLHPSARRVLRCASVLGRSFRRDVLERTLLAVGLDDGLQEIHGLQDFLASDDGGRYVFRNSLIRDAAYEGLAFRTRHRLHAAAGEALEALSTDPGADAPILALHFSLAGDHARTWHHATVAAHAARQAYANAEAAAQYQRALDAAKHVDVDDVVRIEMLSALGETRELAGLLPQSVDAYRRATRLAKGDPYALASVLARTARVHERAGEYRRALQAVARARRCLEALDAVQAQRMGAQLDTLTALIRLGQERPDQARDYAMQAIPQARGSDDPETLVQALMAVDFADQHLGVDVSGDYTKEALQICVDHGFRPRESVARANLGAYAYYGGRWQEALVWYETSKDVALTAGNAYGAAECDLSLGDIYINLGRLDEAEAVLESAVRVLRASGLDFAAAYGQMQRARALASRGEHTRAQALAEAVTVEFIALEHPFSAFEATLVQVESLVGAGHPHAALQLLEQAEGDARADVTALAARTALLRAMALEGLNRIDDAEQTVTAGLRAAGEQNLPYDTALLLRLRSRLPGDPQRAADDAREADRLLTALGVVT